jgi:hypothetical protein
MKTFRIYQHPTRGIESVKVGFSWPAFFFNWFWMVSKQMWALSAIWGVVMIAIQLMLGSLANSPTAGGVATGLYFAVNFGAKLAFGLRGNVWWSSHLEQRGYVRRALVVAANRDVALAQFASRTVHGQSAISGEPALVA